MASESTRTVVIALSANAAIAVAKLTAALITGSSSMFAEAMHALSDTGNEALLLVAQRQSAKPATDNHPIGRGREAYFWSLLAAVGVFVTGAVLAIRQGVQELFDPTPATQYVVAYAVLLISLALESTSLLQAVRQLRGEARERSRGFGEQLEGTSDPTARAVFFEDSAAVVGNLVAIVGVALHQITGSAVPDAIASIIIGLLLAYVAYYLGGRNRDFLIGESVPPAALQALRREILEQPGVLGIRDLIATFTGPGKVWVVARVDIEDALTGAQVELLVRSVEGEIQGLSGSVVRADIVPVGAQ